MKRHIPKKRFGQNFLIDNYIIHRIIEIINPQAEDFIVEIGPGLAALTKPILEHVPHLHVIEIDRDIISYLEKNFSNKLTIHGVDALKFDFATLVPDKEQSSPTWVSVKNKKKRIIGNLPYNISTPLLFHLAQYKNIQDMHFMLQKEVVNRICAKPDNGDYGRLSVMLQYQFLCSKMLTVPATAFDPSPKVESAIVKLIPKSSNETINIDEERLNTIVTAAFSQRRKTITNSLKNVINLELLEKLDIDNKKRAENLTVAEYILLSQQQISFNHIPNKR